MSTVVRSSSGKQLTLDQGTLFDMPEPLGLTEAPKVKKGSYAQESYLIDDLKRHIRDLEHQLERERKSRKQAWDRATDAMEAEHFMRRLAEFMKKFND